MKKFIIVAIVAALMAISHPARAIIVITEGTNTYNGINATTGLPDPAHQLTIAYEVTETTGLNPYYNYDYTLTTTPALELTSFTMGGINDPLNTQTIFDFNYGLANTILSGFNSDSTAWIWGISQNVSSDTVGFSSYIPPELVSYTANDDGVDWSSPALIPAPVPEPSSWALLAGALLVLGFFKYRKGAKLQVQKISRRH